MYTLLGVIEEWPFQHPCLAPISPAKLQLSAYHIVDKYLVHVHHTISPLSEHAPNVILLEKMGLNKGVGTATLLLHLIRCTITRHFFNRI